MSPTPTDWRDGLRPWIPLLLVSLLAVLARLYWVTWVQPPSEAVFSDMYAYVDRALITLGYKDVRPRSLHGMALWPYGGHTYLAALFGLLGPPAELCSMTRDTGWTGGDLTWVNWGHALFASLVAPFAYLATQEATSNKLVAFVTGCGIALWPQLLTYTGFFSSEVPYSVFIAASLYFGVRLANRGSGGWLLGLAIGLGATVRPVVLATAAMVLPWLLTRWWGQWRKLGIQSAGFLVPLVLILAFSAVRFENYTGRFGLISANGEMARLFAITDYRTMGTGKKSGFNPPARGRDYKGHFRIEGKITDEAPVRAERIRVWNAMSWERRNHYLHRNVTLLWHENELWPERNAVRYAKNAGLPNPESRQWRRNALPDYNTLAWVLALAAGVGAVVGSSRQSAAAEFAILHLVAMVYAAAFYFGELRYRVPYDSVMFVLAACTFTSGPVQKRRGAVVVFALAALILWLALPF